MIFFMCGSSMVLQNIRRFSDVCRLSNIQCISCSKPQVIVVWNEMVYLCSVKWCHFPMKIEMFPGSSNPASSHGLICQCLFGLFWPPTVILYWSSGNFDGLTRSTSIKCAHVRVRMWDWPLNFFRDTRMDFPVDVLKVPSHQELQCSADSYMKELLYRDPDHAQYFTLPSGRKVMLILAITFRT